MKHSTFRPNRIWQVTGLATAVMVAIAFADTSAPQATVMVRPVYPAEAQRADIQGCARLRFDLSIAGVPENIQIERSTPYPEFGAAASKALRQWRFQPFRANGKVAPLHGATQAFVFALPGKGPAPSCGSGNAVSAVVANVTLATPKPVSIKPDRPAPPVASVTRPRETPVTVNVDLTRPPVVATFATAADGSSAPGGRVTVRFCVNDRGHTERVEVIHSIPPRVFDTTALDIIQAAEFRPYQVNGTPATACGITQTIVFRPARNAP